MILAGEAAAEPDQFGVMRPKETGWRLRVPRGIRLGAPKRRSFLQAAHRVLAPHPFRQTRQWPLRPRFADTPTLEQRMDDVRAVMDAVGSPRAAGPCRCCSPPPIRSGHRLSSSTGAMHDAPRLGTIASAGLRTSGAWRLRLSARPPGRSPAPRQDDWSITGIKGLSLYQKRVLPPPHSADKAACRVDSQPVPPADPPDASDALWQLGRAPDGAGQRKGRASTYGDCQNGAAPPRRGGASIRGVVLRTRREDQAKTPGSTQTGIRADGLRLALSVSASDRCSAAIVRGSKMRAISRSRPPHLGQARTSQSKTRRIRSAHRQPRQPGGRSRCCRRECRCQRRPRR
jgi:hypothetical protein